MNGPAEPFIVKPADGPPLRSSVKDLVREGARVTFVLEPLSISDAILEARAEAWLFRCDGVVDDGRDGGLKVFF